MLAAFLCLFGMSDLPQHKSYFLLWLCFVSVHIGEYTALEVWHKLQRG